MGNQLLNSMVRGFGMTLGRKAANRVTRPSQTKVVNDEPTFTEKQLELINNVEKIKTAVLKILLDAEKSYNSGNMTQTEYQIIQLEANEQLVEADKEIEKLKSVKQSSGSIWPTLIGLVIGIYGMLWLIKIIKGS
jgi:hypothetical protein